jgi:secreted trypsin-like serine protease
MHTMTRIRIAAAVSAAFALFALPAGAITGGTLDGTAHPNVGVLVADFPGQPASPVCSATLVAPKVVLTAGHCTTQLSADGATNVRVVFDSTFVPEAPGAAAAEWHTDPKFDMARKDTHDLGVVVLAQRLRGVEPARLPAAGALESSAPASVTAVGYGYYGREPGGKKAAFLFDGARRFVSSPVAKVKQFELKVDTTEGGPCFGDSGGPMLAGATLVAVTSWGDRRCERKGLGYRLDTPSAREFVGGFVPLP